MRSRFLPFSILSVITAAIIAPILMAGYTELDQASNSSTYAEAAGHHYAAARRLFWRPDLYELAGHEYYYAREYTLAAVLYQKANQRHALSPDGWVAWGDVMYLLNDPDRATQIWEQGLEQESPSEKLFSRLAKVYKEAGNFEQAAQYLQRYTANHLDDASARYRFGLLLTLTDPKAATREMIAASQLDPNLDPASQTLITALNLAALNASASDQKVIVGRGLGLVDEWELAKVAFEQAAQLNADNAEAWAWIAEADQQSATDETLAVIRSAAIVKLDRAVNLNPNSVIVHVLRGLYFQRVGNPYAALSEFQAAAKRQPDDPTLYVSIAESFTDLGDLIRALDAYQVAAALAPENAAYWRSLAQFSVQYNVNVGGVGVPAAQKLVIITKDNVADLDLLGWVLVAAGRYPEAEQQLRRALELDSQNAAVYFHLALLYLQTDQKDLAHSQLIRARDLGSAEAQTVLTQYFP